MTRYEPVRVIGWVTTAIVLASSVVKQITDIYDEGTGWMGLALSAVMIIATELQRSRVTPTAKLGDTGTTYYKTEG
jgi:hypothetical protein